MSPKDSWSFPFSSLKFAPFSTVLPCSKYLTNHAINTMYSSTRNMKGDLDDPFINCTKVFYCIRGIMRKRAKLSGITKLRNFCRKNEGEEISLILFRFSFCFAIFEFLPCKWNFKRLINCMENSKNRVRNFRLLALSHILQTSTIFYIFLAINFQFHSPYVICAFLK